MSWVPVNPHRRSSAARRGAQERSWLIPRCADEGWQRASVLGATLARRGRWDLGAGAQDVDV